MGALEIPLAIAMIPISILIILEETAIYTLNLPFDKVLIGALLIIALQLINVILLRIQNNTLTFMNVITAIVLTVPAGYYIFSSFFGFYTIANLPLIVGVMMFVESIYALH